MRSEEAFSVLKEKIDARDVSHAYLFVGPDGIGKQQLALRLCAYAEGITMDTDVPLLRETFIAGSGDDDSEEENKEERKGISIGSIREMIRFLYRKPAVSAYRCAIIGDMTTMSLPAQHAILKIIEEPPEHALIFGTVRTQDALLDTIVSRFSPIIIAPAGEQETLDFVHKYGKIGTLDIHTVATEAQGRIMWAKERMDSPERHQLATTLAQKALVVSSAGAIETLLEQLMERGKEDPFFLDLVMREMIRLAHRDPIANSARLAAISSTLFFMESLQVNVRVHIKSLLFSMMAA